MHALQRSSRGERPCAPQLRQPAILGLRASGRGQVGERCAAFNSEIFNREGSCIPPPQLHDSRREVRQESSQH